MRFDDFHLWVTESIFTSCKSFGCQNNNFPLNEFLASCQKMLERSCEMIALVDLLFLQLDGCIQEIIKDNGVTKMFMMMFCSPKVNAEGVPFSAILPNHCKTATVWSMLHLPRIFDIVRALFSKL